MVNQQLKVKASVNNLCIEDGSLTKGSEQKAKVLNKQFNMPNT